MSPSRPGPIRLCALVLLGAACLAQPGLVCAVRCALAQRGHAMADHHHTPHALVCAPCQRSLGPPSPPAGVLSAALPMGDHQPLPTPTPRASRPSARVDARSWAARILDPPPPRVS